MEHEEYIVRVYDDRTEWLNKEGQLHRVGGPAVEYANGDKAYYQNGQLHRLGSPAFTKANGFKTYLKNGFFHRIDGPAIISSDGHEEHWIEGKFYLKEEFLKKISSVKEYTVAQICELLGYEIKIVKE